MGDVKYDNRILEKLIDVSPDQISSWLDSVAFSMVSDAKFSFGTSPSQPGDPPGVASGTLRGSMHWEPGGPFIRYIEDQTEYGIYLELGTEKMAARPFMVPLFDQWSGQLGDSAVSFGLVKV